MTKVSEKLDSLKKEKEMLAKISKSLKSLSQDKKKHSSKKSHEKTSPLSDKAKPIIEKASVEEKKPISQITDEKPAKKKLIDFKKSKPSDKPKKRFSIHKKGAKKKKPKKKLTFYEQKRLFGNFIKKSGIDTTFSEIHKKIMVAAFVPILLLCVYLLVNIIIKKTFFSDAISLLLSVIVFGTVGLYLILWVLFFVYIDIRIYQRRKEIETVFPDFLQLTAANINAGMPIDRALWFAIRPRFGILAKEIESVAKATMVGENLHDALTDFSNKYDSITIKRALNLLLEGLESGGEVGDLLTRVANNIRETEIIKKEMAANVTTYVIFILFATLAAAPFLFGLTTVLIVIMRSIISDIHIGETGQSFGGIGGLLAGGSEGIITVVDYQIFAITSIAIAAIFAAILISIIQKGNAKESFKSMPFYIGIGIVNYLVSFNILNYFLSGFFS